MVSDLKWYRYDQNNSYGRFEGPHEVFVQASSMDEADRLALRHTEVYFDDDCDVDCPCCGSRWSRAYMPGTEHPKRYGSRVDVVGPTSASDAREPAVMVFADGSKIEGVLDDAPTS